MRAVATPFNDDGNATLTIEPEAPELFTLFKRAAPVNSENEEPLVDV